jgi:hypothetical protein
MKKLDLLFMKWLKRLFCNDWEKVWYRLFTVNTWQEYPVSYEFKIFYSPSLNEYKYTCEGMNSWVRGIENAPSFQEGMRTFNDYQINGH